MIEVRPLKLNLRRRLVGKRVGGGVFLLVIDHGRNIVEDGGEDYAASARSSAAWLRRAHADACLCATVLSGLSDL